MKSNLEIKLSRVKKKLWYSIIILIYFYFEKQYACIRLHVFENRGKGQKLFLFC